jgi:hypothetical protein
MTLKMKADIKQRWIEELRSGRYKQGRGELHRLGTPTRDGDVTEDQFCCLGVLSKMCHEAGATPAEEKVGNVMEYGEPGDTTYLPLDVIKWAGMKFEGRRMYLDSVVEETRGIITYGATPSEDGEINLSIMNDNGSTFEEIADVIEKHVVGV